MLLPRFVVLLACAALAWAQAGIDVSQPVSASTAQCLARSFQFAIVRCFRSTGTVDPNCPASVHNLRAAGIPTDAYAFPAPRHGSGAAQAQALASMLHQQQVPVGRIWLDIEQPVYWLGNQAANLAWIEQFLAAGSAAGFSMGVYCNWNSWWEIVGHNHRGSWSSLPLWYPHYARNGQALSDFRPFGGWTTPVARQYSESGNTCGVGYDINYSPNFNWLSSSAPPRYTPVAQNHPALPASQSVAQYPSYSQYHSPAYSSQSHRAPIGGACSAGGRRGTCMHVGSCTGTPVPGYCQGSSSYQCCVASYAQQPVRPVYPTSPTQSSSSSSGGICASRGGTCQDVRSCSGSSVRGLCPGGYYNQCCIGVAKAPAPKVLVPPTPPKSGWSFLNPSTWTGF